MTPAASFSSTSGPVITREQSIDTLKPEVPFKYEDEQKTLDALLVTHSDEQTRVDRRRTVRKNRINVAELRNKQDKPILSDETVIPDRTIDMNIRSEKGPYVSYVEKPTVILDFSDSALPNNNLTPLAVWHASLIRQGDWKLPKFLAIDALLLHGASYKEVVFSENSPSRSVEEYIRREDLIFPEKTKNIQACGRVYRRYEITRSQLADLARKYQFDSTQVAHIEERSKNKTEASYIYKSYIRNDQGVIYVAWTADTTLGCTGWLKPPTPLQLGLFDITPSPSGAPTITPRPIKVFPIIVTPYHVEEDEIILETQGRASLDLNDQDALTSLMSATVNGTVRASRFYPTRKAGPGATPKNEELFQLRHGFLYEGEFSTFQPNYPNNIAVSIAQVLQSRKAQQIGATDYAAMNRQDTRKTARELDLAQQTAAELTGPNISLFSLCEFKVEYLRWEIILSGVRMEMALNLPIEARHFKVPANIPPEVFSSPTLIVSMAADAQVVRRAQRESKFLDMWPVVASTPYALPFLESMLSDIFPEDFPDWKKQLGQTNQQISAMTDLLNQAGQAIMDVPAEAIPEERRPAYAQLLDALNAATSPQDGPK